MELLFKVVRGSDKQADDWILYNFSKDEEDNKMKRMGKTKRFLAATLALMVLVSTVAYDLPVHAENVQTENSVITDTQTVDNSASTAEASESTVSSEEAENASDSVTENASVTESESAAAESDTATESESAAAESDTATESESTAVAESDTATESESTAVTESDTATESESTAVTESDTAAETESETVVETGTETETSVESEAEEKDLSGNDISDVEISENDISGNDYLATVNENGLRVPDGDETYVDAVKVTSTRTGVSPFDEDNEAGNDENAANDVIRSFDDLTYNFEVTIESRKNEEGVQPDFDQDVLCMEAYLPCTAKEAIFDITEMDYLDKDSIVVTTDANGYQTLTARRTITKAENDIAAIPGKVGMLLAVKVRTAENGRKIKPEVKFYMEHNKVEDAVSADLKEVTVSAVLRLNVDLKLGGGGTSVNRGFDFNTGNDKALNKGLGTVNGQSFCYGVTVQLYNPDSSKGMRGLALPKGDLSFDIAFSSSYKVSDKNSENNGRTFDATAPELAAWQPLVWSVDEHRSGGGQQDERSLSFTRNTYAVAAVPGNKIGSGSGSIVDNACENGGIWSAEAASDGSIKLTVKDYEIPLNSFPWRQLGSTATNTTHYYEPKEGMDISDISIACFSAGEIWIVQPDSKGNEKITEVLGSGEFTVTASTAGNIQVTVDNGNISQKQECESDDTVVSKAIPGGGTTTMSNRIRYSKLGSVGGTFSSDILGGTAFNTTGNDYAFLGQNDGIGITAGFVYGPKSDPRNRVAAANMMMKFDSTALELVAPVSTTTNFFASDTQFYYGYLGDGTSGWGGEGASEEERDAAMMAADEKALNWDSAIDPNKNYVAVLAEKRGIWSVYDTNLYENFFSLIKVRNEQELVGNVYMICQSSKIWTVGQLETAGVILTDDDANDSAIKAFIPSVTDEDFSSAVYPETHLKSNPNNYKKATYNEYGVYTGGHNGSSTLGDSVYIYGYTTEIDKSLAILQEEDGTKTVKTLFDLDRDECIVDYVLSPGFKGTGSAATSATGADTTVTVVDTLPEGLEYNAGSAYIGGTYSQAALGKPGTVTGGEQEEPEIGTDSEGKTTLTWKLDCKAGAELPKIYFSCTIDSSKALKMEKGVENIATVAAENESGRKFSSIAGNLDSVTFKVRSLGSSSFTMSVDKKLVELNEDIKYFTSYDSKSVSGDGENDNTDDSDNTNDSNNTTVTPAEFVLLNATPCNGVNGSVFEGSYEITSWKMDPDKSGEISGYTLYYTADAKYAGVAYGTLDTDTTVSKSTIEGWNKITINADGTADFPEGVQPTAWALVGKTSGSVSAQVEYVISQDTPGLNDKLVSKGSEGTFTRSVFARRVNRIISGYAWLDSDQDGEKDTAEALMEGLEVTLQVKDDKGNWVQAYGLLDSEGPCVAYTDANGYSFGTLPAGEYRVVFKDGSNTIKLAACGVTTASTAAEQKKSIASAQTDDNDKLTAAIVGTITLPALEKMNGALVYEEQWQNAGFTRTVEYEPKVTKLLTGDDAPTLNEGVFSFELTLVSPLDEGAEAETDTKSNGAANSSNVAEVVFDKIQLTDVGTYVYKIKEVIPTSVNPSITYDNTEMPLTVVVEADKDGALVISSATYKNGGQFTNTYKKPTPAGKAFEVSKAAEPGTGTDEDDVPTDIDGLFTFTLTAEGNAPMPVVNGTEVTKQEVQNNDGSVKFDEISFTEVGTYEYKITEKKPADVSWSKDSRTIKVTVEVTLNKDNTLSAEATYSDDDSDAGNNTVFTNVYTLPEKVTADFDVSKSLNPNGDRTELVDGEFSFTLTAKTDGAPMPAAAEGSSVTASCAADGTVDFGTITYTEDPAVSGTDGKLVYVYEISEISENEGTNPSVTYDDKNVTVTVTVTKDENNKLQKTVTYSKNDSAAENAKFENTYTAPEETKIELTAGKELNGRTLKDKQFEFTLTPVNAAPMPAKADLETLTDVSFEDDGNGNVISVTVKNAENGSITFPAISVKEDLENFLGKVVTDNDGNSTTTDSYVYTYEIKEVQRSVVGYTYDTRTITATVTVTKNDKNELVAAVVYKSSTEDSSEGTATQSSSFLAKLRSLFDQRAAENVFVNTYTMPKETEFVLEGKKVLEGKSLEAGEFRFKLEPLDNAPGKKQTVKNKTNGSFEFEAITVAEIGDVLDFGDGSESKKFSYKITEVNEGKTGYTYDSAVYVATVEIRKNQNNELEVVAITYEKKGKAVDAVKFVNTYRAPSGGSEESEDDNSNNTITVIRDGKTVPVPASGVKSPKTGEAAPFAGFAFLLPAIALTIAGKKKDEE